MGKYDDFEQKYGLAKPAETKASYSPGKYDDFEQKYGLLSEDEKRRRDYKKTKSEPFVGPPEELAGPPGILDKAGAALSAFGDFAVGGGATSLGGLARATGEDTRGVLGALSPFSSLQGAVEAVIGKDRTEEYNPIPANVPSLSRFGEQFSDTGRFRRGEETLSQADVEEDSLLASLSRAGGSVGPMTLGVGTGLLTRSPGLGALAMGGSAFGSAYQEGRGDMGLSVEDAQKRGLVQAGVETAAERLGLKYVLPKPVKEAAEGLLDRIINKNVVTKVAGAATVGALEESATTAAQMGLDEAMGFADYSGKDYARGLQDAAVGGSALSGGVRAATVLADTGVPAFDAGKDSVAEMKAPDQGPPAIPKIKPRIRVTPEGVIPPLPKAEPEVDPAAFAPEAEVEAARQRTAVLEADVERQERQSSVLADLRGSKDRKVAEAVKGLYDTGRLKFYGDAQALPEGANSATDKGYFDGKTLYLNEAKLEKGEATSVALHEVKHYMDSVAKQNGEAVRERSLRRILGDEGNTRVNERITQLAQSGNKIAQESIADATAGATVDGKVDPTIFQDEVGAYFLQRAQQARESKTSLGRAGVVLRDMVSYAKAKLADFGIDLALSDNDILYLGRQLAPKALKVDAPSALVARASIDRPTTEGLEVEEMGFDPALFPQREEYLNNNASGESEASLEAINRVQEEKELGRTRLLLDKDGTIRPLEGVQAVDTFARDGQVIVQRGVGNKEWTVISSDPKLSNELIEGRLNAAQPKIKEVVAGRASKERPAQPKKVEKVTKAPVQPTERTPAKDTGVAKITKDIGPRRLAKGTEDLKARLPEKVRQLWDVVLSPTQGKPADVTEASENAKGKALLSTIRGEQAANRLREAITGAGKKVPKAQRPQVERVVTKLVQDASAKDEAVRTAAREALKTKHPAVYAEYMDVRNNIKRMGLEIRKSILDSGRRLTNADLRNIKAIEANMETYVSRAYRADIKGEIKRDWTRKTQKAWEKEKAKGKIESEGAKVFEDAKDYLRNQLNIGTFDEVMEAPADTTTETLGRLKALYEAWVPQTQRRASLPEGATPEQRGEFVEKAIEDMKAKRAEYEKAGTYDATLEQKAVDLTKEILQKAQQGGSPMAQFFRGARLNRTVVMQREGISPKIRKLWGEIEEPVAALATTLMRQGRYIADSKMLDELYEMGKGRYFEDPANATGTQFTESLSGESLGPLAGMMATPQFKQAVESHVFQTASIEAFLQALSKGAVSPGVDAFAGVAVNLLSRPAGMVKNYAVIWNPEQYVMNAVGSVATPILSGFLPGQGGARGIKAAAGTLAPGNRRALNKRAAEMFGANMQESGQVGEIQQAQRDLMMKELLGGTPLRRNLQQIQNAATDLFAATDNAGRFATVYAWSDWLKKYYKARGETRSDEQIFREAAERTKRRSITFSRVPALGKAVEKTGATMFLPYFLETYRVIGFSLADSFADVKAGLEEGGKAGAMKTTQGMRGVAGGLAALAFNRALIQAFSRAAAVALVGMGLAPDGEDEDKEKLSRIQKGMEQRFQGKTLTLLEITPEGRYVFLEGERMSMLDPAMSPLNKLADGDLDGAWTDVKGLLFPNSYLARLFSNILQDRNRKPTLANTIPETYREAQAFFQESVGMAPNTTNAASNIAELFVPSVLKTAMAASFDEQDFGPEVNALVGMGVKVAVFDPKKALQGARFEYGEVVDKARDEFKDVSSAVKVSDETLRKNYQGAILKEFEAFERLQHLIEAARATEMSDDDIRANLKDAGLTKGQITSALDGEFKPSIVSEKVRKAAKAKELKAAKTPEQQEAIEEKYERIESIIDELNSQNELQGMKE